MKIYYHTWKHGFEQTIVYHGKDVEFYHDSAVMVIKYPILDSTLGLATVVQLINTDEVTVEECADCPFHGSVLDPSVNLLGLSLR